MKTSIIAAVARNGVIGKNNDIPWRRKMPADMDFFKKKTTGHPVITGRKNYESIPPEYRPLKKRTNIILTRQIDYEAPGCIVENRLTEAIIAAESIEKEEVFIIGGAEIYKLALPDLANTMYITKIHADFEGDVLFPEYDESNWRLVSELHFPADEKNKWPYSFLEYERIR